MTALIFLVHPLNSETVLHASNLQDILFFFFGSLALLILVNARQHKLSRPSLFLIFLMLLLSAFSKETGLLFGLMSAVYAYFFSKKNLIQTAVLFILTTIILFIFRFGVAQIGFSMPIFSPIAHASLATRMLNMPGIFIQYLKTFIFPRSLDTAQFWLLKEPTMYGFYIPLIISLVILGIVNSTTGLLLTRQRKFLTLYIFFALWFIFGIGLHLQIIPLEVTVALRWFYFPIIGLLGLIATVFYAFADHRPILRKTALIICLIIVVLFSYRTYVRVSDWKDSETLFTHELRVSKGNYLLQNNLATLYIRQGKYREAKPLVTESVKQYQYFGNLNNMAILFAHEKNFSKAAEYFKKALKEQGSYMVYQNYANFLLYYLKDYKEALAISDLGLQKYPAGSGLYLIKAQSAYRQGNFAQALKDAKMANTLLPSAWTKEVYNAIQARKEIKFEKYFKLD